MTVTTITDAELTPKDYASDQEVRWCPGCGDYAILKAVQKALAELGAPRERTVFVSGIGCAARFPYYLSTYGFHTIHGRAPAIATGIKLANPALDVWVVTGDGDGLSIGGNHMLHALRRNVDLQIILFNNEIYGLTKGQYSPTSRRGTHSPSTPQGSVESPVSPCAFALGAGARFVARAVDTQQPDVVAVLKRAHAHRGASFVEVFQNCVVFNDGVFDHFTAKDVAGDAQLHVEHGKPLLFGRNRDRGLRLKPGAVALEVVPVGQDAVPPSDILVHDETNRGLAQLLVALEPPEFPVALGVLYCNPAPSYEADVYVQARAAGLGPEHADLGALLRREGTWTVEPSPDSL
jgi:2-oxoglutarate/2-oxoacid ferredoxin oxidoreductase subunit beta